MLHPNAALKYPSEGPASCVPGGTPAEAAALAGWGVAGWREGLCTFVPNNKRGNSVLGALELCCVGMLKHPTNNELKQDTAMAMKLHQRTKLQLLIYCSAITITTHPCACAALAPPHTSLCVLTSFNMTLKRRSQGYIYIQSGIYIYLYI